MSADERSDLQGPERLLAFADLLQRDREKEEEPEELQTWVVFGAAGKTFGLPVTHVREILRVGRMTRVPGAPFPVLGVTNLRGSVLPVVDLGQQLGLGGLRVTADSRILVVDARDRLIGVLVDKVDRVTSIAPSLFGPAPAGLFEGDTGSVVGLYPEEEGDSLILLDAERLLMAEGSNA